MQIKNIFVKQFQIEVNRIDIEPTLMLYNENTEYFRSLCQGQIKIKGVKKYLDVNNFRTNNIQSYLFQETEKVPSFIIETDLDIKVPYKKQFNKKFFYS